MSSFYTDQPPLVLHNWLASRIGLPWSTDFRALAKVEDLEIIAVVGFEGFTGTSCRMHMAGTKKGWITRDFIKRAFNYPFNVLGLTMVFGLVPSGNTEALDVDLRLGFRELLYIPGAHPDGGLHLLQMLRSQCRWLEREDGKQSTASS